MVTLLLALAPGDRAWSGPRVVVEHPGGISRLRIDGQPHPASWLTLRAPTSNSSAQTALWDAEIAAAASAGIRLVCVAITPDSFDSGGMTWVSAGEPLPAMWQAALERAIALHPRVLFILRFYAQSADLPNIVFANASDGAQLVTCPHGSVCSAMNSITAGWANQTGSRIQQLLLAFDRRFPGRIAGVAPSQLHTSEWIQIARGEFGWVPDYSHARRSAFCARVSATCATVSAPEITTKTPSRSDRNTSAGARVRPAQSWSAPK